MAVELVVRHERLAMVIFCILPATRFKGVFHEAQAFRTFLPCKPCFPQRREGGGLTSFWGKASGQDEDDEDSSVQKRLIPDRFESNTRVHVYSGHIAGHADQTPQRRQDA
ncbi:hypothetical protein CIHG_03210 [Coccidioides immitis H538.4]|uniref:Uncharacterized protein n=1 Tax=Coccidioides immitis H538.4 TaxID=396776 RepID=A0A0J8RKS7_COCIT|nr:hypothetical protein CIHG_03210 [Coccidioides immitis H538.4]